MPVDYEHELGNGWGRWEKLVLGELQRISSEMEDLGKKVDPVLIQAALTQQAFDDLKQRFEQDLANADKLHEDHETRLRAVEQSGNQSKGVRKYKEWLMPLVLTVVINVLIYVGTGHPAPHIP